MRAVEIFWFNTNKVAIFSNISEVKLKKNKPPIFNNTAWPENTRMRTTAFTRVTTMQVTGATVDSCFVFVKTQQHGIAFQPQAMSCKGELRELL